ncbi:MAG: hypothetical protein LBE91_01295, partial [Tannerella sp.]|nr:hypothetical protein [Tannerella sp.]
FQKYVQKLSRNETSFLPDSKNKTTSVDVTSPPPSTSLPHYHAINEVMRLLSPSVIFLLRLFCRKNEVKMRFFHFQKRTDNFFTQTTHILHPTRWD